MKIYFYHAGASLFTVFCWHISVRFFLFLVFSWFLSPYYVTVITIIYCVFISLESLSRSESDARIPLSLFHTRKDGGSWGRSDLPKSHINEWHTWSHFVTQVSWLQSQSVSRSTTNFHKYSSVEEKVCTYIIPPLQSHLKVPQTQQGKHDCTHFRDQKKEVVQVY